MTHRPDCMETKGYGYCSCDNAEPEDYATLINKVAETPEGVTVVMELSALRAENSDLKHQLEDALEAGRKVSAIEEKLHAKLERVEEFVKKWKSQQNQIMDSHYVVEIIERYLKGPRNE